METKKGMGSRRGRRKRRKRKRVLRKSNQRVWEKLRIIFRDALPSN